VKEQRWYRIPGNSCKVRVGSVLAWLIIAVCPSIAPSQSVAAAQNGIVPRNDSWHESDAARSPSLLLATVSSAIVPGAGQALLGSRRAIAYGVAEVAGLVVYSVEQRDGTRQRNRYRELSRRVARAQFIPDGPAGNWDYYERMEKYAASGAFDAVPGGSVDPETDQSTYNGSIWLLARQTYWRDSGASPSPSSPAYQSALAFYAKRAIPPEMRWSWLASPDGFQQYKRAIAGSNSAFKRAEQTAGLVIANHILSAVDAFVSVRLRARQSADGRMSVTAGIPIGFNR
jgi:hypothetical protein